MTEEPTYYFILPEVERPVGGVNVLLQYIDILNAEGYRAAPLYGSAYYQYKYATCATQGFYLSDLETLARRSLGRRAKLTNLATGKTPFGQSRINAPLQRKASDVYVMPEYGYPELFEVFEGARRILAVQDVFGFLRAFTRDTLSIKRVIDRFDAAFTTSAACYRAVNCMTDTNCHRLTLNLERPGLAYRQDKKLQIAYMPRKRAEEVEIVVNALKNRAEMADVFFTAIENVSEYEGFDILGDSLIFLSFSSKEGFGLPPAEAMAAGCLVVGYTGVGGGRIFHQRHRISDQ